MVNDDGGLPPLQGHPRRTGGGFDRGSSRSRSYPGSGRPKLLQPGHKLHGILPLDVNRVEGYWRHDERDLIPFLSTGSRRRTSQYGGSRPGSLADVPLGRTNTSMELGTSRLAHHMAERMQQSARAPAHTAVRAAEPAAARLSGTELIQMALQQLTHAEKLLEHLKDPQAGITDLLPPLIVPDAGKAPPKGPLRSLAAKPSMRNRNKLWGKLHSNVRGSDVNNAAAAVLQEMQANDRFSLVAGARRRHEVLMRRNRSRKQKLESITGGVPDTDGGTTDAETPRVDLLSQGRGDSMMDDSEELLTRRHRRFLDRTSKVISLLAKYNPVAFLEDAALQAEAEQRSQAEQAYLKLAEVLGKQDEGPIEQFRTAVTVLAGTRPFFLPPVVRRDIVDRPPTVHRRKEQSTWSLEQSVFVGRRKENDSRDLFDGATARKQQFVLDWQRVVSKARFRKMVGREDKGVKGAGGAASDKLEIELGEIREELQKHCDELRAMFNYYSMISGPADSDAILEMNVTQWTDFCGEVGILEEGRGGNLTSTFTRVNSGGFQRSNSNSGGLQRTNSGLNSAPSTRFTAGTGGGANRGFTVLDVHHIFIAVNFEEENTGTEAEANDDDAMMRFEFYEGIVRAAFTKFIATKVTGDASNATQMIVEDLVLPSAPPDAVVDSNTFRRERLYTRECDALVRTNWELLVAVFKLYKAKARTKYFWIEHWIQLLEALQVLGPHTGVDKREAKLLFVWSQMLCVDELKRRRRAVSLVFFDMVEALARLADALPIPRAQPPPDQQGGAQDGFPGMPPPRRSLGLPVQQQAQEGVLDPAEGERLFKHFTELRESGTKRPPMFALSTPPQEPLHVRFGPFLSFLSLTMQQIWGGREIKDTIAKMMKMATMLSGGIELG